MFIVGLTGGLATGKSTVLSVFKSHGIAVIDADEVARQVLEPGTKAWNELKDYFGEEVLLPDGKINRPKLAEIIFDDIEKRRKLNYITHPRIQNAMMRMAIKHFFSGSKYIVMEVPLLFETENMLNFMHKIITVVCEDHQQVQRLCKRSHLDEKIAKMRIGCQMSLELKVARSDFVIDNTGDFANTRQQTESIIRLLKRSKFTCEDYQQLQRLCKMVQPPALQLEEKIAKMRITSQMPLEPKVAKSDIAIDNATEQCDNIDFANTRRQSESKIRLPKRSKFTWIALMGLLFGVMYVYTRRK